MQAQTDLSQKADLNKDSLKIALADQPEAIFATDEQAAEINASEESLRLFYLTRLKPMTLDEIASVTPPEHRDLIPGVLKRFRDCGLLKLKKGTYETTLPNAYINFSRSRYNQEIEAQKDRTIFSKMKENAGNKTFWEDQTYFSTDYFFTEEQAQEINEILNQAKAKAKEFAKQNKAKEPTTMKFRRFKFYNMIFSLAMLLLLPFTAQGQITTTGPDQTFGHQFNSLMGGGGDDPTQAFIAYLGGTGDDPKAGIAQIQNWQQVYNLNFSNAFIVREPIPMHGSHTLIFEGLSPEHTDALLALWFSSDPAQADYYKNNLPAYRLEEIRLHLREQLRFIEQIIVD